MAALQVGEAVRAFYHANDHPAGYRFCRLLDAPPERSPEKAESEEVVIGLSTGWIPATVSEAWDPDSAVLAREAGGEDRVLVRLHGRFLDAYREEKEVAKGMYWRVPRSLVRQMALKQPAAEVSLLVVRWWDYYQPRAGSRTHNVANQSMILDMLQNRGSPHAVLGAEGRYEVHSAFIRKAEDLLLLDSHLSSVMRGKSRAAFYFLWPTQKYAAGRPCVVPEPALLGAMARMEQEGVRTVFPHHSSLYRELAGKLWTPRVCQQRPDLRVPATVRVDLARWAAEPALFAEETLDTLLRMKASRGGCSVADGGIDNFRGVAKLGFSWMGEEVHPFEGKRGLMKVLEKLLGGTSEEAVCMVQERIENTVCEVRFLCHRDLAKGRDVMAKELVRMDLHRPRADHGDFSLTSHQTLTREQAAHGAFGGGRVGVELLRHAELEAERLSELWLQWFQDEGHGLPTACRLDFLVAWRRGQSKPDVWTVELCESGGSLCGFTADMRTAAIFNDCLLGKEGCPPPDGCQPLPLPPMQQTQLARANQGRPAHSAQEPAARGPPPSRNGGHGRGRSNEERAPRRRPVSDLVARMPKGMLRAILGALALLWLLRFRRPRRALGF